MINIPIGKALIAVETEKAHGCGGCFFLKDYALHCALDVLPCVNRKDGKNVIFKLVDMPKEAAYD
ncbi:hypothetical protein FACS1894110_10210 [Spirochaetia bacterium]|nr:hypothetical protein FACS1894110_10210 [Spirochaetia bacterium]